MRRYLAVLAACVVTAAMLVGCQAENNPSLVTEDPATTEGIQRAEETEAVGVGETESLEATEMTEATEQVYTGNIEINTKFGRLYYQDQWEDFVRIELTEEDTCVTVAFVAEIDNTRYSLFRLVIGESDGEPVGQITDEQGAKHNVFVYMEEISGIADLTEGEQNRLFAMQEEINYIIENLE